MIGALGAVAVMFSTTAFAQGTAAEARAMLEKAVAAVKADKAKALAMFNKGEGGFRDRDLYPFCFNISDGHITAAGPQAAPANDVRKLKDQNGKAFGEEIYKAAQDEKITEVHYLIP